MRFLAGFLLAPAFISLGFSSTVASILSGLVLAAGSLLLAFLFAPKPPKPDDGKFAIRQTIPPRAYGYGTARVAGSFVLKVNPGKGGRIYQVQALVSHKVNSFNQLYLNDDLVDIDSSVSGNPTDNGGAVHITRRNDGRYGWDDSNPRIWVDWRYGEDSETPYWITAEPDLADFFTATAVGNRIASSAFTFADSTPEKQTKRYPYGAPDPSWVLDLAYVYDPRDAGQDLADRSTWQFDTGTRPLAEGRNPVLAIIHYLCFNEFGFAGSRSSADDVANYNRMILPLESEWIDAANICEEQIATYIDGSSTGLQNRYELGGYATTENDQKAVLVMMLAACDGWLARRGDGAFVIRVGKWLPSGVSLDDEDITGWQYQRGRSDEEVVNRLETTYNSPDHHYSEIQCDAWEDEDDQTARGHVRSSPYDLTWVQDYRRARRLAKREFKRLREPIAGTLDLKLSGINAAYERFIYIGDVSIPGLANRYIENRGVTFSLMAGGLRLQFVGVDSTIDDWGVGGGSALLDDEGTRPPVIDEAMQNAFEAPANLDAYTVDDTLTSPGSTLERLIVEFDKPIPLKDYDYSIRWRITDTDTGTAGDQPGPYTVEIHRETPTDISSTRYRLKADAPVPTSTLIDVQIAVVGSHGVYSDYTNFVTVLTSPSGTDILIDDSGNALTNASGTLLTE